MSKVKLLLAKKPSNIMQRAIKKFPTINRSFLPNIPALKIEIKEQKKLAVPITYVTPAGVIWKSDDNLRLVKIACVYTRIEFIPVN